MADLDALVAEYLLNRSTAERAGHFESRLKARLMAILEAEGTQDGETKQVLGLEAPLTYVQTKNGKVVNKTITGIERVKRTMTPLNAERAMDLITKKGLLAECTETIVVVNEDALLAANFDNRISDKELSSLYDESTNFAFYLTEGGE